MLLAIYILFSLYTLFMIGTCIAWLRVHTSHRHTTIQHKFTVIIPARNEATHIIACLESIAAQSYPHNLFHCIIIDDFSVDDTAQLVQTFLENTDMQGQLLRLSDYPHQFSPHQANKKAALALAIEMSHAEWIVQTDADCITPTDWLQTINQSISTTATVIAGPVRLIPVAKQSAWLYHFQSLDFMTMQVITHATHLYGIGRMSNGANMAFSKDSFHAVAGYHQIDNIASGDDMLLLQKITRKFPKSSLYLKDPNAIVDTASQGSWKSFLHQRIRWSSKAGYYADKRLNWLLAIVYLVNLSFPILMILGIFDIKYLHLSYQLFFYKIFIELCVVIPGAIFFNLKKQLLWFPFLQPLHILYVIIAGFLGMIGKYEWKGRIISNK